MLDHQAEAVAAHPVETGGGASGVIEIHRQGREGLVAVELLHLATGRDGQRTGLALSGVGRIRRGEEAHPGGDIVDGGEQPGHRAVHPGGVQRHRFETGGVAAIGQAVPGREVGGVDLLGGPAGAAQPQRLEEAAADLGGVVGAGDLVDHAADQSVAGVGVLEAGTRTVHVSETLAQRRGELLAGHGLLAVAPGVVRHQARAHGEQLAQSGFALIGREIEGARGLGHVGRDGLLEAHPALVPQGEQGRGGEGLGHRGDAGDGRPVHRRAARRGCAAVELAVPGRAVGEDRLLVVVATDDRPGHPGGLVLVDGGVEQGGDGGVHGIGQDGGGGAGLRHEGHCRGWE